MKHIQHYVITRFSLNFKNFSPVFKNQNSEVFGEERLNKRIEVFKKTALQSIIGQSNKNFYWVIMIDSDLPKKFKDIMQSIINDYDNIFLYEHDKLRSLSGNYFLGVMKDYIPNEFYDEAEYIITTKLDDDDYFHPNTINVIQSQIDQNIDMKFIAFKNGLLLQDETYYKFDYPINTGGIGIGLSLICKKMFSGKLNIYAPIHTKITEYIDKYIDYAKTEFKILETTEPFWIYVRHQNQSSIFSKSAILRSQKLISYNYDDVKKIFKLWGKN